MALKTGAQYIEEMKKMRPNVYKWGELIRDVTTHPATKAHIANVAMWYDNSFDPEKEELYTTTSYLTGKKAHRWNTLMTCADDVLGNANMKRDGYRMCGSCMGPVCAGWTVINALWGVTWDMDKALGTDYHERLKKFAMFAEENALALSGALTDAKGNRALKPGQQDNSDMYLHVKEVREDGIVIRGYKNQICGVAGSQYIMVIPTTSMSEGEEAFAVAAAVPRDAEGITVVETRRPSDTRTEAEGWDGIKSGTTQAFVIFDDVFVPNERVFMNGEVKYAGACVGNFTAIYRAAIGACVAGQGDVMIGAAIGMARANGLTQKPFQDKLTQMAVNNETTYGLGIGAMYMGKQHPSGAFYPNPLLAHVNKVHVATLPYNTKVLAQEISGGITETGCMPSYQDMMSPVYGKQLIESLRAGVGGEDRIRMARLVEWLTIGGGVPGCMHGGGSPDTAKMVVKGATRWDDYVDYARSLAKVEAPLKEEKKKK
ncbi:4-hydroxyphenylacetate 3-hydroxylase N-terminal domain-containing protein [Bacilliculturomica massiliensis]|uniref:4-hydroxyphenylacetate 3-hydroxylase N-terminal domain-containing protein n=1 Tax=Bacilliculturomica massiliensis TaxID=1917867 RepID=UPI001030E3B3|nr:4-hydroxyphenylacetate 3-hydroxylase N-terminal domain-containing protein [Bacilliculturomica massiliensis]